MKKFKGKKTTWEGLWRHGKCWTSASFNLKKLKDFEGNFHITVTRNKAAGYDEDEDYNDPEYYKPEFLFSISGSKKDTGRELEIENDPTEQIKRLSEILHEANYCPTMLPSESRTRADWLFNEARTIIEQLTGARWYFEVITWG